MRPIWVLKRIAKIVLKRFDLIPQPPRYANLYRIVNETKARRMMEIGTCRGRSAQKMIKVAKRHWSAEEIEYYGFDLFEDLDKKTMELETSLKPLNDKKVKRILKRTGANIKLYKGNTMQTLPKVIDKLPKMDIIFIDGGHSIETIKNDWNYSKELIHDETVIIFDDYWNLDESGCNEVIRNINEDEYVVEILNPPDRFKRERGEIYINFVKIKKRIKISDKPLKNRSVRDDT